MVDPYDITNYNLTYDKLEEVLLFWVCVAGKKASTIFPRLNNLLKNLDGVSPFDKINNVGLDNLAQKIKDNGIGCYNNKAKSLKSLANSGLDLKTCTVDDLENIYGIGMKTARCFLMHSRPNVDCAGLDTHVLKFLRSLGHDVPKSTPGSKKKYKEIEQIFLHYVKKSGMTAAELDLDIWVHYSNGVEYDIDNFKEK